MCILILARGIVLTKYLVCKCGWKSKPYPDETMFAGVGGQLSCPICTKLKRNRNIEVYGNVQSIEVSDLFNPSKRKNKKSRPHQFFCNIIGTNVTEGFCEQCLFKEIISECCYWKTATEGKSSEGEDAN